MSNIVRFISDLHFGHRNLAQSLRGFQDEFYHDEHIIDQWNRVVGKKDITYILGDITMEKKDYYFQLDRLNGKKYVVLGNHDLIQHVPELLKYVEKVGGMVEYKGHILTHCPIHESELRNWEKNIHGHIHASKIPDSRYINVSFDVLQYPRTLDELLKISEEDEMLRNKLPNQA